MVVRTHQLLALTSPVSIDTRPPNVSSWNRSRLRRPHVSLRCIVPPANRRTSKCGPIRRSGRGDGDDDSPASMADFFERGAKMTSAAAKIWRCSVLPGDTVVDATCGESGHVRCTRMQLCSRCGGGGTVVIQVTPPIMPCHAGRGHDAVELARLVGRNGTLIAIDLQVCRQPDWCTSQDQNTVLAVSRCAGDGS